MTSVTFLQLYLLLMAIKAPFRTVEDNIVGVFLLLFSEKIKLDISCEPSVMQTVHMKYQALFS